MKNENQDVYSLMQGIQTILAKNRCSLQDEEKKLLENCLTELRKVSIDEYNTSLSIEKIAKWLLMFFELNNHLKDFF